MNFEMDTIDKIMADYAEATPEKKESFSELTPHEQGALLKDLAKRKMPSVTFRDASKKTSDPEAGYYQVFLLNTEPQDLPRMSELVSNRLISRNVISLQNTKDLPTENGVAGRVIDNALTRIYKFIHQIDLKTDVDVPEDWLAEQKLLLAQDDKKARLNEIYYKQAIEQRRENIAREFKIHIQVRQEEIPVVMEALMALIESSEVLGDKSFDESIYAFKAMCVKPGDRRKDLPSIVVYPKLGKTPSDTMRATAVIVAEIKKALQPLKLASATPPRYNKRITDNIFVAQSSGDLKDVLKKMTDPTIPADFKRDEVNDTLIATFFSAESNFAFFNEEKEEAMKMFG